jgi:Cu/Ag efflux protein CusF
MITRKTYSSFIAVFLGIVLSLLLVPRVNAEEKKAATKSKQDRLSGRVQMISKDTSTITLRKGTVDRHVVYNDTTKFTMRNKPAKLEDLKEGRRVICLGKFDEKTRLVATHIDIRGEQ